MCEIPELVKERVPGQGAQEGLWWSAEGRTLFPGAFCSTFVGKEGLPVSLKGDDWTGSQEVGDVLNRQVGTDKWGAVEKRKVRLGDYIRAVLFGLRGGFRGGEQAESRAVL